MAETVTRPDADKPSDETPVGGKPADDVPIDEELLEEAMRGTGTPLRNTTINAALEEYVLSRRQRRREALENLQRMSEEGAFDHSALG